MYAAKKAMLGLGDSFTPLDLFASGEKGFWLDATDISTLFQDFAATIPVTSDNDPVASWEDKSGNAFRFFQTTDSRRPIYKDVGSKRITFNGTSQGLFSNSARDLLKNVSHGIVAMSYVSSASPSAVAQRHLFIGANSLGNNRVSVFVTATSGTNRAETNGRRLDTDSNQSVGTTETKFVDSEVYIHNFRWGDALLDVYKDSNLLHSTAFQTVGATSNTNSIEQEIGYDNSLGIQFAQMELVEVVVVGRSTAFTPTEINALNTHMKASV
jgi:hypothetical protein